MKLLVIDSDRDLVDMLTNWLKTLGYEVHRAYTVERARSEWLEYQPDLVILDITLKDVDMLSLCRELRMVHDALTLVVTDGRDVKDEIRSLESGADDYLRKPFYPSQLVAHIRAVSRRARTNVERRSSAQLSVGAISIDSLRNEVTVNGQTARLTPTESKLLHLLAINVNDVCTANQIVTHVWGYAGDGDAYLIKSHIRHLRQKVEVDPSNPQFIMTVPGVGYTLVHRPVEESQDGEGSERALRMVSL